MLNRKGIGAMSYTVLTRKSGVTPAAKAGKPSPMGSSSLRIGEPNDAFEKEAERVAGRVMAVAPGRINWSLSRMGSGLPLKSEAGPTKSASQAGALAPPIIHEVLRSPGQPLDATTRAFMEPRFGHDFSNVRVHADAKAGESARAVDALAYTVRNQIAFGASRYAPGSLEGRKLLAHELTHTIQQSSGLRETAGFSKASASLAVRERGAGLMRQTPAQPTNQEDSNVTELKTKVGQLVKDHYGGDYPKAFAHYDANHDGGIDAAEIKNLLSDAGIGNFATRGKWAEGILQRLDKNHDGRIQWSEFESGIK